MSPNLAAVVRQSVLASRIVTQVDQEIRLRKELTKHASVNCEFFSENQYLICPLHPGDLRFTIWEINNCKDWKLTN